MLKKFNLSQNHLKILTAYRSMKTTGLPGPGGVLPPVTGGKKVPKGILETNLHAVKETPHFPLVICGPPCSGKVITRSLIH